MIRLPSAALMAILLSACATPALQVKVPTMTVADAWRTVGRSGAAAETPGESAAVQRDPPGATGPERLDRPALARWRSAGAGRASPAESGDGVPPIPVVTAPEVRMAWVRPWQDAQGNRHFGHWVALPVQGPRWVLPDGSLEPIEGAIPMAGGDTRRGLRGTP